MISTHSDHQG